MNTSESDQTRWFFEELHAHEPSLRAWLKKRFPSVPEVDTDDIVQEAYVRVLKVREERGELKWPKAFLYTTVRNLTLDLLRHRRVARENPLVESGALEVADEAGSIPEAVARRQELEFLNAAIQALPDRCRQAFTLRRVDGLSQKETATRLGISEHTVSAQLSIALHKCTKYLISCQKQKGRR